MHPAVTRRSRGNHSRHVPQSTAFAFIEYFTLVTEEWASTCAHLSCQSQHLQELHPGLHVVKSHTAFSFVDSTIAVHTLDIQ